ncbi:MAG: acyl-CoA dehydratase activase [Acidobacteriota bacterium]|jgi:predicted CoA-substrate-specific enzyme activase|nr:acyl-CoA dehydratase activase [Acidobacteriota bacterium]
MTLGIGALRIGADLGSTAIKLVIYSGDALLWRGKAPTAPNQESIVRRLIAEGLSAIGAPEAEYRVVATGYGKKLYAGAVKTVDEISANALGLSRLSGGAARTIVNIGGQDSKVIRLSDTGRIVDFKMNDKCAAGTGRFFEQAARLLDVPLEDFVRLGGASTREVDINSTCVVFAESELVSLVAAGVGKEDIIRGLCASVARRTAGLLGRHFEEAVYLDGGPAVNSCLVAALEDELATEIHVLEAPQHTVACGAALSIPDSGI